MLRGAAPAGNEGNDNDLQEGSGKKGTDQEETDNKEETKEETKEENKEENKEEDTNENSSDSGSDTADEEEEELTFDNDPDVDEPEDEVPPGEASIISIIEDGEEQVTEGEEQTFDNAPETTPTPEPSSGSEATPTPEPSSDPEATPTPEPSGDPEAPPTPAPNEDPNESDDSNESTETTEPEQPVKNAIQKAIDAALSSITENTTSVTIQVEAGEYDGDINISRENVSGKTSFENFILNIVTASSKKTDDEGNPAEGYEADKFDAIGDSSAKVKGNINIDGIDVLLAGIYLSLEKRITVKGADLTVIGTAEDDGVNVMLGEDATAVIDTGEGDDTVKVTAMDDAGKLTVSTGGGNDTVTIKGDGKHAKNNSRSEAIVNTGNGSDRVELDIGVGDTYSKVDVESSGDYHLNLSGALDDNTNAKERIKAVDNEDPEQDSLTLKAVNKGENVLTIKMNNRKQEPRRDRPRQGV